MLLDTSRNVYDGDFSRDRANYAHSVARRGGASYNQAAVFTSTCVANVNMYK